MAKSEDVAKLVAGVEVWNNWRKTDKENNPDLSDINFISVGGQPEYCILPEYSGFDLSHCNLNRASLRNCIFSECDFSSSSLHFSDIVDSRCVNCNFQGAELNVSKIGSSEFISCDFTDAQLSYCSAEETSFIGSTFIRTKLDMMSLVKTDFSNTMIDGALVYGISAWDLNFKGSVQQNIYISDKYTSITVPNIELAQFIALLVNNSKIREIIDTISSKVVLILGRFTKNRKAVLDAIKNELQIYSYVPVLFDFEGPKSRDFTETILTLASISKFIIADLSMAKSIPQELSSVIPHFPSVPIQPIIQKQEREYSLFEHFEKYPWVMSKLQYTDEDVSNLVRNIVKNQKKYISTK
jgi:uncharacterized protein YjbI with pentapeptide repeats